MPGINSALHRVHNVQTLGPSADTGPIMLEAKYFGNWTFGISKTGTVTTGSITFYGTTDPNTAGSIGIPGSATGNRWFVLPAAAEQGGAGTVSNPVTAFDGTVSMNSSQRLLAVRYVTNAFTGGGSIVVDALATP